MCFVRHNMILQHQSASVTVIRQAVCRGTLVFHKEEVSWEEARQRCLQSGTVLTSRGSGSLADRHDWGSVIPHGTSVWLGGRRVEEVWTWSGDTRVRGGGGDD